MQVICKNNDAFEDQLTEGHCYTVLTARNNSVEIINDAGEVRWYGTGKFLIWGSSA